MSDFTLQQPDDNAHEGAAATATNAAANENTRKIRFNMATSIAPGISRA